MKILFITWDGPQVNYLQSLFLPIFAALKPHGFDFDVLQFRWGDEGPLQHLKDQCATYGSAFRYVRVNRQPPVLGPFLSAFGGRNEVRRAVQDFAPDVLMPRSLMPALAVLAAGGSALRPIIFDGDGLEADERVEFRGLSRLSPVYRFLRSVESRITRKSEVVLTRSNFATLVLADRADMPRNLFHVVTNGRDERLFDMGSTESRIMARKDLGLPIEAPVMVYSGSVGIQYRLDLISRTAAAVLARDPRARLMILTPSPAQARAMLSCTENSILQMCEIRSVPSEAVGRYLCAADLGFSFRSRTFSARAISPIKTAEYLLCGVPVFGTAGIGNTDAAIKAGLFKDERIGTSAGAEWLCDEILPNRQAYRERARQVGLENYSMGRSVSDYVNAMSAVQKKLSDKMRKPGL